MSNEGKQVARWAALVAGSAVVGAGIGLLFAPQTGTETRRGIARSGDGQSIRSLSTDSASLVVSARCGFG